VRTVADYVRAHCKERPIILLSGPSGSGKTTTAHLLEQLLDAGGHETHTLSMDNYFHPMSEEEKALAAAKKLDLESPDRVDRVLLQDQLTRLLRGESVQLPTYNFVTAGREYRGDTLTRKEGEIVILEGIHALNPNVVGLPEEKTVRLYVSVRTRIVDDEGNRLHPSYIRLTRRMMRDRVGRGRPAAETLRMFDSVQRGENLYIMPYKPHSLFDIDTLIPYELCIYKKEMLQEMQGIPNKNALKSVLSFLQRAAELDKAAVPHNSLIQEFI
jgi:uridine kinase